MASEVKVAGGKIDEDGIINQLLVAMPSVFNSVVSFMDILYNKDKSAVSLEYVKNTLLAEEERLLKKAVDPHNVLASYRRPRGKSGLREGEYVSSDFKRFCDVKGIHENYSMARNSSQNGVAERMNQTLLEKTRCLLLDSIFGKEMWGEAIMTVTYLSNRLTTSDLPKGVTPAERVKRQPMYLEDFELNFAVDVLALSVCADATDCYEDAVKDVGWRQAINEELASLESNRTWEVVEIPPDVPVIDSRWIFYSKSIVGTSKKKVRLVTRCYQQPTMENEDIFAQLARMTMLRVLLSVAAERGLQLQQLNVRSAFLKSKLPASVYTKPPDGLQCSEIKC
ncbi:hypothetical protein PR048_016354 [Dryococelus australis]|uniref:Integrase catalytic domain-containing protein n=1 Tax=Dryococelus australis TaxID=614101 RepID=A0ABQ9HJT2_9NEOP|nr:hypothetical protein PR048_016354 [Dryococelus australis]